MGDILEVGLLAIVAAILLAPVVLASETVLVMRVHQALRIKIRRPDATAPAAEGGYLIMRVAAAGWAEGVCLLLWAFISWNMQFPIYACAIGGIAVSITGGFGALLILEALSQVGSRISRKR